MPGDLQDVVLETIRDARVLKTSKLKSALPKPYQRFEPQARIALEGLVARGEVWRRSKNKTVVFFARDPVQLLDEALLPQLPPTFDQPELAALTKELASGCELALVEWLGSALERRLLFEHEPASRKPKGKKVKRFGREPDVHGLLAPVIDAIQKLLPKADALGVPRRRIAETLMAELGLTNPYVDGDSSRVANEEPAGVEREGLLSALSTLATENPRQALLPVRDLRGRVAMSKDRFDALALQLSREGLVSLHLHDLPSSLTPVERDQYVRDERGNYYIGIAPRRGV